MPNILAIDQGTSGTKAIVVNDEGAVLATAEQSLRPRYLPDGAVEQDPHELYRSILDTGRRALSEAAVPVDAIALANQGESILAWDPATNRPLSPIIVWQDRRAEEVCSRLTGEQVARARDLTGLVVDPYFVAPKMRWLRGNVTTEGVVTTTDTWIVHQLCGAYVTDVSTASRTLLFDLDNAEWSDELVGLFDLRREVLPDLVASDDVVGYTEEFGPRLAVTGLIVDQQAALLAESCLDPGTAKCTFGTGAFLLAQSGIDPLRSSVGLTSSVAWRLRESISYCIDGQVYTAASAVRWAIDLGLLASPEQIDTIASPDNGGVLFVPALAGLAAPWWDPNAAGVISGLTLMSGPGQLVRALMEGIAAEVAQLASLIVKELGSSLTTLRVDGGLTKSAVLMQAQADLAQIPVEVYPSSHATALGAATCARLALDPSLHVSEAVSPWSPARTFEPLWSASQANDHLARWEKTVSTIATRSQP